MVDRLDLSIVEKDLTREALQPAGPMPWLRQSYDSPDPFWASLLAANSSFFAWPSKTLLHRKYDFYHDIFARNRQNPSPAFRWHLENKGWQELGYSQLGRLSAERASRWESLGATAGRKLCIVSHLNERFLVSLLAALKIGLTISLLPPWGSSFLRRRIDAVTPDFIWATEEHLPLLTQYRPILLFDGAAGRIEDDSRSHSYTASEPFALCFDPSSTDPHLPRELTADCAYLSAVRDGAVALGLKPGQGLAAPGFDLMETQPALLLGCLLNGATYVHLNESDVSRAPRLLVDQPLKAVGITEKIREILLDKPIEVGKAWNFWFRDPAASQDVETWAEFVEVLRLRDALSGNLRWNASLGGCILFSVGRKGSSHRKVLPAAGIPWHLVDPADVDRYSIWSHGWFALQPPGMEKGGIVAGGMLTESRNEWIFLRPVFAGRSGKYYPVQEVLEALSGLPHGASCSVVETPASRADGSSLFVLLVFVGGRQVSEAPVAEGFRNKILKELGREFLPDVVQIVPLHPRRSEDGSIDHEWCGKEYLSGGLTRRARAEVSQCITKLKDLIHFCRYM
ncbi:MAG: hypothetical protein AB9866_00760 [Syntrophobacteraceae bacterium]